MYVITDQTLSQLVQHHERLREHKAPPYALVLTTCTTGCSIGEEVGSRKVLDFPSHWKEHWLCPPQSISQNSCTSMLGDMHCTMQRPNVEYHPFRAVETPGGRQWQTSTLATVQACDITLAPQCPHSNPGSMCLKVSRGHVS